MLALRVAECGAWKNTPDSPFDSSQAGATELRHHWLRLQSQNRYSFQPGWANRRERPNPRQELRPPARGAVDALRERGHPCAVASREFDPRSTRTARSVV